MRNTKTVGLWGGIAIFLLISLFPAPEGLSPQGKYAAATAILMTVWWVTEAIPIYATAFVPLVAFPLTGVLTAQATAANFGHNYVLMLLGGFFLSKAIESQNLHKRIALLIIRRLGSSRSKIILSFMLATAFLSMWIANVAVTLLMLPIALAIVAREEEEGKSLGSFGIAMMLAIAYSASVGGTATLIGTPPNLIFMGVFEKMFPSAPTYDFFSWLKIGFPVLLVFLPIIWIYIVRYFRIKGSFTGSTELIDQELTEMGKMSAAEKRVLAVFIFTAFGWIFRRDLVWGSFVIPGWSGVLGIESYVHDSTVAIFSALLLFALPGNEPNSRLLDWQKAGSVPWGVVMIVGGGYAIAESFSVTGLAVWIGHHLSFIGDLPLLLVLVIVVGFMLFLTEINSNTATANIFLPILATMAISGQSNPLILMIPATFACSLAFMLPSGTGTNTVIFASNRISISQMVKCGFWLNLISIVVLTILLYALIIPILGIDAGIPDWALDSEIP